VLYRLTANKPYRIVPPLPPPSPPSTDLGFRYSVSNLNVRIPLPEYYNISVAILLEDSTIERVGDISTRIPITDYNRTGAGLLLEDSAIDFV
jgi:hypothetical protein